MEKALDRTQVNWHITTAERVILCDNIQRNSPLTHKVNVLLGYIYPTIGIFSAIDGPLDFNEILVNGSVFNVISRDNISFFAEIII